MHLKRLQALVGCTILIGTIGGGCLAADEDLVEPEHAAEAEAADPVYLVQVVDLDRGGEVVASAWVTESEQLERRARVEAGYQEARDAISEDLDCVQFGGGLLKLWNQTNYTGNQICFTGTGVADLNDYNWCVFQDCTAWTGHIRSLETGNEFFYSGPTLVSGNISCCDNCTQIAANTASSSVSSCVQSARYISRDTACHICMP